MSDIETIATTIATDFVGAVKAATKARQAQVDAIASVMDTADETRTTGLAEVRRLQEDAARIVADSIRLAERVEARYRDDLRAINAALNELRGPTVLPRPTVTVLEGGKS